MRITDVPSVREDGDCTNLCIFHDKTNWWCYESTPPMLQIGWKWGQTYAQTADTVPVRFYSLKFMPYFVAQGYIKQEFNISRMYYNLFIVDLARFAMNPFLTITMNGNGYVCYGIGYDNDLINM